MVFKMISRHWQTCLNGSLAANASVIQWRGKATSLASNSPVVLLASSLTLSTFWHSLLHLLLIALFLQVLPKPWAEHGKDRSQYHCSQSQLLVR